MRNPILTDPVGDTDESKRLRNPERTSVLEYVSALVHLGRSRLAHTREMRQAIVEPLSHGLDLENPVAPDLMPKVKELFTTALSITIAYGVLNLEVSCLVNLALVAFEMGDEKDALSFLSQYLDALVDFGRERCVGCGQTRHKDVPVLTCSGCGVAR